MGQVTLFCLPHAGGSASIFAKWKKEIDCSIKLHPIELAGRGERYNEEVYSSLDEAVEDIYSRVKPMINSPFAFFGHSMGSLLVHEVSCKIKQSDGVDPLHLFVSGRNAPQFPTSNRHIHLLPEDDFKNEIINLRGTPKEILQNQEIFDFFKPILKADYKIVEEYQYPQRDYKLNCAITVLNGKEDNILSDELIAWSLLTHGKFNIIHFEGGHFFIHDNFIEIVQLINKEIGLQSGEG
ncbi:thioesterase domain-containing protein [Paenibacillus vini]|uniref:thioesterase II family protein n=1 Tax=Paenibacillus vini TaxID=1476024 RepID=UPI0025B6419D|nr:thioesterase domain-containing protein [Paenibacillus vini]MDN4066693.1 thioesterase domain-containing protein [Paenibacillus vini]